MAERHVDTWLERLHFVDPARLAVVSLPGASLQSVEVYCERQSEAEALVERFGGKAQEVLQESWQPAPTTLPGKPLSIAGGRLLVTARPEELVQARITHPRGHVLLGPGNTPRPPCACGCWWRPAGV